MSPTDIAALIPVVVFSVILLWLLPGAVRAWQTYSGTSARRQENATGRAPEPEGQLAERITTLEGLGYRRIGETWTSTPSGSGFSWALASGNEEAYALLAPPFGRPAGLTGFYSAWPDGEWLGTLHPFGSSHERAGLRLRIERGTLVAAEAGHRAAIDELREQHRSPRRITGIADVLMLDAAYRTRFGGRELRPRLFWALLPTAIVAAALVSFLIDLFAR